MKNLYFDDFEDFACAVADTYDSLKGEDYEDISIIAKYEEARQIIKELICLGYDLHSIDIDDEVDGYNAEYIITLYDNEVWCDPMLREKGYITDDSPVMYVLDNCSSKVIPYCKGAIIFEVSVGDEFEDEGYTVNGKLATKEEFDDYVSQFKKSDENPATTKDLFFINGKSVDKSEFDKKFDKKFDELEEKYLDNIRDMLLNHLEFQQEMRKFLRW